MVVALRAQWEQSRPPPKDGGGKVPHLTIWNLAPRSGRDSQLVGPSYPRDLLFIHNPGLGNIWTAMNIELEKGVLKMANALFPKSQFWSSNWLSRSIEPLKGHREVLIGGKCLCRK